MILKLKEYKLYKDIDLTPREMDLLYLMCSNKIIPFQEIIKTIYGDEVSLEDFNKYYKASLALVITRLRKKGLNIKIVKDKGYKLEDVIYVE